MPILSRVTSLLRNLFQRRRSDEALDAEVHGYVDMLADEKIRAGMNPEDARRAARIELGGVEQTKEQVREVRAGAWLEILAQDFRYGVRMLVRILQVILRQGFALALTGCAMGLAGAFAVTRLLSSMLYGVSPRDAATFVGIPLLLLVVALLASYLPARRAMQVDPMVALRYE